MKAFEIAIKDLLHFFRNGFSLVMMFAVPLLIPAVIFLAFGNSSAGGGGFDVPAVKVVAVNLDQPDLQIGWSASQLMIEYLQGPEAADMLSLVIAADEAEARHRVQQKEADVALIIPPGFTAAVLDPSQAAEILLINEPTLTIGPQIVKSVINGFLDGLSGAKIAVSVAKFQLALRGVTLKDPAAQAIVDRYTAWVHATTHSAAQDAEATPVQLETPSGKSTQALSAGGMIGPVTAAMIIFFVFFTGANGASMIVREEEDGTLARLFTCPIHLSTILGGKFLSVLVTLVLQVGVLLLAGRFIFGIQWGRPLAVALAALALVMAASGFGVFAMSFIRTTRQTGIVLGGGMVLLAMVGGLYTAFIPDMPAVLSTIALVTPQGWAMRSWKLAMAGSSFSEVLLPAGILLVLGMAFYAASIFTFRKRFA